MFDMKRFEMKHFLILPVLEMFYQKIFWVKNKKFLTKSFASKVPINPWNSVITSVTEKGPLIFLYPSEISSSSWSARRHTSVNQ